MFNFPFYNPLYSNFGEYIRKNNIQNLNQIKKKYNVPLKNTIAKEDNFDFDFDFCNLSDFGDSDKDSDIEPSPSSSKNINYNNNELISNCAHNKFISFILFTLISGGSFATLSFLYYNYYIKK